jgi:hypothetical protein
MAFVVKDRVKETTTTTGTGTITLAGAASGFQAFSVIGDGNTTYYTIAGGSEFEVGVGTYTLSGTTLSRDIVLESSNSGSLVNFSAGAKDAFVTYPAERSVIAVGGGVTSDTGAVYINKTIMNEDTTIEANENGLIVGPFTVAGGVSFTVTSGQRYIIL